MVAGYDSLSGLCYI